MVKMSLAMLSLLINRKILTVEDLSSAPDSLPRATPAQTEPAEVEANFDLLEVLMKVAASGEHASSIGQLLSAVLPSQARGNSKEIDYNTNDRPRWTHSLKKAFRESPEDIDKLATYVLPVIYKQDVKAYALFLDDLGWGGTQDTAVNAGYNLLLYASLATGNELGILAHIDELPSIADGQTSIGISHQSIDRLLRTTSAASRMTGLKLLITSPTMTRPFRNQTLRLLRRHLPHLHSDTDADFRGELFGVTTRLFDRLRTTTSNLARRVRLSRNEDNRDASDALCSHKSFTMWYLRFAEWELRPTANYQRHICALRCLLIAMKSGIDGRVSSDALSKAANGQTKWPFDIAIMHPGLLQLLIDLLMDPFEDVRQAASSCLSVYANTASDVEHDAVQQTLENSLKTAEARMLTSGRADNSDGVAHLYAQISLRVSIIARVDPDSQRRFPIYDLIRKLSVTLDIARTDLSAAVMNHPIHGTLTAIRYTLTGDHTTVAEKESLLQRLVPYMGAVWDVVKEVLCNDAPEGYLPEGSNRGTYLSTKDTLSFCWRALKESSLLVGVLLTAMTSLKQSSLEHIDSLCELTFTQLAELRHRGAFSTVAQTWALCCSLSKDRLDSNGHSILSIWYGRVLTLLQDKFTINTRRSAGLPALLCGLLIADQTGALFERAISNLESISRSSVEARLAHEGSLPQVHAMNCIKDVLKNSKLSERSERYVTRMLRLASDSLLSHAWAIRNCGLMLFRAVIDRMVGTNDAFNEDDNVRKIDLFEQHAGLLEGICALLHPRTYTNDPYFQRGEAVFPALQLLQRIRVPETNVLDIQVAVLELTANPSWHIRVMAAKTYASLVDLSEIHTEVGFLLSITSTKNQNGLHGALVCAKYLMNRQIQSLKEARLDGHGLMKALDHAHEQILEVSVGRESIYKNNKCGFTKAAWVNLWYDCQLFWDTVLALVSSESANFKSIYSDGSKDDFDVFGELRLAQQHGNTDMSSPFLTKALAVGLMSSLRSTDIDQSQITELLVGLSKIDPDAFDLGCKSLGQRHASPKVASHVMLKLLSGLKLSTRASLAALKCFLSMPTEDEDDVGPMTSLIQNGGLGQYKSNPSCLETVIEIEARLIEAMAGTKDVGSGLRLWLGACELILEDPLDQAREGVARGLTHFDVTIKYLLEHREFEDTLLDLVLMTITLLNDDDEDIRLLASLAGGRILSQSEMKNFSLVPIVASQRLLGFLVRKRDAVRKLPMAAFARAFGIGTHDNTSFYESIDRLSRDDVALFAEEKQNLYIDGARETRAWSQAVMHMDAQAIPRGLIKELAKWTKDGLDAFTQDSARGDRLYEQSCEADMFTLGLQLFYGVEVLLWLVKQGVGIPERPSMLLTKMQETALRLEHGGKGHLWLLEVRRILDDAVSYRLRTMRQLIVSIKD